MGYGFQGRFLVLSASARPLLCSSPFIGLLILVTFCQGNLLLSSLWSVFFFYVGIYLNNHRLLFIRKCIIEALQNFYNLPQKHN